MRHKKKGRKLNRSAPHRKALRQNLAKAVLEHERIVTTKAKAKEARRFVEKLITLARKAMPHKGSDDPDSKGKYLHYYRQALSKLQDKRLVQKLFGEGEWRESECLGERYLDRDGGYTRIIRLSGSRMGIPLGETVGDIPQFNYEINGKQRSVKAVGNRLGDNAPRVIFELVEKVTGEEEEEEVEPVVSLSEEEEEETAEAPDAEEGAEEETVSEGEGDETAEEETSEE